MQKYNILAICLLLLAVCSAAKCDAPYVTATYQPLPSGYLVQFQLYNSTSDDHLYGLGVDTVDATSPVAPPGWYASQTYRDVRWLATLSSAYVQPGQTLGGFSYISQAVPCALHWWTGGAWGYNGSVTPAAVPEPSSLLVLGAGGFGLLGAALRWRRG